MNFHQNLYLRFLSQNILLNLEKSMFAINSKLITASNIKIVENIIVTLNDFRNQDKTIRKYFKHRTKTHDFIKVKLNARKEKEMIKYNRKINKMIHEIKSLIIIY